MNAYLPLLARVLISAIFLLAGIGKITTFEGTRQMMASQGMPAAGLLLVLAILLEIGGALSILLGYKARIGGLLLFLYLIPATLLFHADFSDHGQQIHFMKNLAVMGGLLMVYLHGSGSIGLDHRE